MPAIIEEVTPLAETLEAAEQEAKAEADSAEETEAEAQGDEAGEQEAEAGAKPEGEGEKVAADDDVLVTIGDEKPAEQEKGAPEWVRDLRKANREKDRKIRELEARLQGNAPAVEALGPKPSLADPDVDYDEAKYEAKLAGYMARKSRIEAAEAAARAEAERQQQAFQSKLAGYESGKSKYKAAHIEEAEETVRGAFNERQQAILVKCAKDPALMVLALGNNPGKLKELASMTDLADFTYSLASVEAQLKVTKTRNIPDPEKRVNVGAGGGAVATGGSTLDKLREEAARTGDMSKVLEYKRKQRQAA